MAKKKQGDGSVFQRRDGRWEALIKQDHRTPVVLFGRV